MFALSLQKPLLKSQHLYERRQCKLGIVDADNKLHLYYASVGGATRHTVIVHVCLSVCMSVCLSALVLKDGEESAGGNCNVDITR